MSNASIPRVLLVWASAFWWSPWPSTLLARPPALWLLLIVNGFVWPHVAYQMALRSPHPYQTERQNFLIDSGTAGVWLVAMGFNPLPGALVTMMLWMNNMVAGGPVLFLKGVAASVAGILFAGLVLDFQLHTNTDIQVVLSCLPLLIIYPLMIGEIAWRLAIQLSEQKKHCSTSAAPMHLPVCTTAATGKHALRKSMNE